MHNTRISSLSPNFMFTAFYVFTMEVVENTVALTQVTRTDLSDWSGAPVAKAAERLDAIKLGEDRTATDHLDLTLRGYDLFQEGYGFTVLNYGPSSAPLSLFSLAYLMKNSTTFQRMFEFYEGVAYDSVEFRITASNPKGLVGGFVTGVYPFTIWNTADFNTQKAYFDQNNMTRQHLMLSPYSELITYGAARDIVFEMPWQHNVPYLPRQYIKNYSETDESNQLWPGTPVLYFISLAAHYVSAVSLPSQIRCFVRFKNLRFSAPVFESQSGVEAAGALATSALDHTLATIGAELFDDLIPLPADDNTDSANTGSYENPQAVQLAYVGDSTRYGPPATTPIFRSWSGDTMKHKLIEYLRQPQFLEVVDSSNEVAYYSNPTAPKGVVNLNGADQLCTYLRYFSQACSYWRGTLILDFVIMGHPLVEVSYYSQLFYPPFSLGVNQNYSQNSLLRGVCSGTYRISVPLPYMTPLDHLRILDSKDVTLDQIRANSSSGVVFQADVVSTALALTPVIPTAVFIRAGDDFEFLQPYAVGYGYTDHDLSVFARPLDVLKTKTKNDDVDIRKTSVVSQVGLPDVSINFETRAKAQQSVSQMLQFSCLEDFMNIWSRSLPYSVYDDNDEPIVDLPSGITPYWYPQVDTGASHTLDVNNSWWITNDYVSLYSSMFLFYKGSIGFKVLCLPSDGLNYKYLTIYSGNDFRQPGHDPFTTVSTQLPSQANFGYGVVATDLNGQPVLETTIPLRSAYEWSFCNPHQMDHVFNGAYRGIGYAGSILTNVVLHVPSGDLQDALYRKAGKDFNLSVRTLLPPPTLWVAKGYDWS